MNDDELRSLIRAAIERHMGAAVEAPSAPAASPLHAVPISFGQYRLDRSKDDTMCLIEPAVQCNHCGYCKCHGH
jgi:hypothetical protein